MRSRTTIPIRPIAALSLLLLLLIPAGTARAATLCFSETGQCVGDPFGDFWQGNGGLPVFGFPIAAIGKPKTGSPPLPCQKAPNGSPTHWPVSE